MSVASDLNSRKSKLQTILQNTNAEIAAKGGNSASTMAGIPAAVASIAGGGELEEVTITPNGQQIVALPEDGYDGFSKVTVNGDANLVSANIKDGVTIYGVVGTAKGGGADEKNLPIPSDYQSYVSAAKLLYTGDYTGLMILDSGANTVAVCFFMDDFSIQSYDVSTTAFSMIGAYYCKYLKDAQIWEQLDYRTSVSTGDHYGNHIKFATRILFYGTTQVWPSGGGNLKEVTVTPTGQQFTVTPESGYDGFNKVIVDGDANLIPENIKAGVIIFGILGTALINGIFDDAHVGSAFASYMSSIGYSWTPDGMNNEQFCDTVYGLVVQWAEESQVEMQRIADMTLVGLTANGAGKLQCGYAWVQAARSFAEWFQDKFFAGEYSSAVVNSNYTVTLLDGTVVAVTMFDSSYPFNGSLVNSVSSVGDCVFSYGDSTRDITIDSSRKCKLIASGSNLNFSYTTSKTYTETLTGYWGRSFTQVYFAYYNNGICLALYGPNKGWCGVTSWVSTSVTLDGNSLIAEKPQEVHYPDVAEDGSQVYEITVGGVTATDIVGILQGSVDSIIAGASAITGTVISKDSVS